MFKVIFKNLLKASIKFDKYIDTLESSDSRISELYNNVVCYIYFLYTVGVMSPLGWIYFKIDPEGLHKTTKEIINDEI